MFKECKVNYLSIIVLQSTSCVKNLDSYCLFIKEEVYRTEGEQKFELTRKKLKVAAYDGDKILVVSTGLIEKPKLNYE